MMPAACTSASVGSSDSMTGQRAARSPRSTRVEVSRACSMAGGARSRPTTCQPSPRSRAAIALPIPELDPVTTALRIAARSGRLEVDAFEQLARPHDLAANERLAGVNAFGDRLDQRGGQSLGDCCITHRFLHQRVQRRLDRLRRALGRPNAVPGIELEAGEAGL